MDADGENINRLLRTGAVCYMPSWQLAADTHTTRKLRYRTDLPYEAGKTFMASFAVAEELFVVVD